MVATAPAAARAIGQYLPIEAITQRHELLEDRLALAGAMNSLNRTQTHQRANSANPPHLQIGVLQNGAQLGGQKCLDRAGADSTLRAVQ